MTRSGPMPSQMHAAGIDRFEARALERAAEAVEVPPGHAVLHGDDGGVGAEQRRDLVERRRDRMGLQREDDIVLRRRARRVARWRVTGW